MSHDVHIYSQNIKLKMFIHHNLNIIGAFHTKCIFITFIYAIFTLMFSYN